VVCGILWVVRSDLHDWRENLVKFENEEMAGFDWVMQAAPARERLHYVKLDSDSKYFTWRPFLHVEKMYMGERLGQVADTPAILSTAAIRLKPGVEVHRLVGHSTNWPEQEEIWDYFDLVLVRK